jgi:hypothetical protein
MNQGTATIVVGQFGLLRGVILSVAVFEA